MEYLKRESTAYKTIEGIQVSVDTNNCTTIVFQMQTCTIILVI